MKILIVAESFFPRVNGVSNSVQRCADYLSHEGHEVFVVGAGDGSQDIQTMEALGIEIYRTKYINLPSVPDYDLAAVTTSKLMKIFSRIDPDVVHLASPFYLGWLAQRAARRLGIPTVAIFQTDVAGFAGFYGMTASSKISNWWSMRIHRNADLNLVPSNAYAELFQINNISNSIIWRRGVDALLFNPTKKSEALKRTWRSDNRIVVGYVGRLAPEKQIDRLVCIDTSRFKVVIIGDGPQREQLEKLLPDAHFAGKLVGENLASAMASLDILVAPGEHETFCQVIQEAMASGVPVVAPRKGGPVDLIDSGHTGFLYEPSDNSDLLKHLEILAGDESLRIRFGVQARTHVESNSWESVFSELVKHYESVLENRMIRAS